MNKKPHDADLPEDVRRQALGQEYESQASLPGQKQSTEQVAKDSKKIEQEQANKPQNVKQDPQAEKLQAEKQRQEKLHQERMKEQQAQKDKRDQNPEDEDEEENADKRADERRHPGDLRHDQDHKKNNK